MKKFVCISVFFFTLSVSCWAQYWIGDGGSGMRLGVLAPESHGLSENQAYLPLMVQGCLVANISKYSAISVLDRVSLDRVIAETLDPAYEDNLDIVRLGHVAHVGYWMTGSIMRTSTGYALQINVTDTTPNARTIASYSGVYSVAQLNDQSAIQNASLELLTQMGVRLTERAINELNTVNTLQTINAQTALAQGISAQRQGSTIEALSHYIQARNYNAGIDEISERLNIISSDISSGNIGEDTRNDIAWRRQWIALLQETEAFYVSYTKENPPYYLIYDDTHIMQGAINYQVETVELGFYLGLFPEAGWVNTINEIISTVKNGLQATGRAGVWGIDWPRRSVRNNSPFIEQDHEYAVVTEILNSNGLSLGRRTNNLEYGNMTNDGILTPNWAGGIVIFPAINANLITDLLRIRVVSIDGLPADEAARRKNINIIPVTEYNSIPSVLANGMDLHNISKFTYDNTSTKIVGYNGPPGRLIIPVIVNGFAPDPHFRMINTFSRKGITDVIIPSTFSVIRGSPFINNSLVSITLGNGVFIDDSATIVTPAFERSFIRFYNSNGRKSGTYTRAGNNWTFAPQ